MPDKAWISRPRSRTVYHTQGQGHSRVKDEIEKVINGQSGKVSIRGRLHPGSSQNSHADGVTKDAERYQQRNDDLLDHESSRFQLTAKRRPTIFIKLRRRRGIIPVERGGHVDRWHRVRSLYTAGNISTVSRQKFNYSSTA